MTKYFLSAIFLLILFFSLKQITVKPEATSSVKSNWEIKSIDTVKYSRDLAREKRNDPTFLNTIDTQVKFISGTGATHIALGTPYDQEFIPFLKTWVAAARKHNLKVWFRGNFSGWENWFGYRSITRENHIANTKEFILTNGELFESGDIFSSCPECENGGPGDPRETGDVDGHRSFLVEEYKVMSDAFRQIGKGVRSNFFSMNGDVAKLIMDEATTKELGGIVVADHYVESPDKMVQYINEISNTSGGKVVLGEFGLPIPDIHGELSQVDQAKLLEEFLIELQNSQILGINYWTSFGGSTRLWENDLSKRPAADVLKMYYNN